MAVKQAGAELTKWNFDSGELRPFDCLIKVDCCGICHSDIHMIDDDWEISQYPLVPGHEAVGKIVQLGSSASHLKEGQRVGVGWQAEACMECSDCRNGNENLCSNNKGLIVHGPGGFADHLRVDSRFAFPIPDGLKSEDAGPLMCGGVTVYSALRSAGYGKWSGDRSNRDRWSGTDGHRVRDETGKPGITAFDRFLQSKP